MQNRQNIQLSMNIEITTNMNTFCFEKSYRSWKNLRKIYLFEKIKNIPVVPNRSQVLEHSTCKQDNQLGLAKAKNYCHTSTKAID